MSGNNIVIEDKSIFIHHNGAKIKIGESSSISRNYEEVKEGIIVLQPYLSEDKVPTPRNISLFSYEGEKIWDIEPPPKSPKSFYILFRINGDKLLVSEGEWYYEVDIKTGKVLKAVEKALDLQRF